MIFIMMRLALFLHVAKTKMGKKFSTSYNFTLEERKGKKRKIILL